MKKLKEIGVLIGIIAIMVGFIYGGYWIAKTVSYSFFYEDMVEETIKEMVKPEALKGE
jgi:hypothetical protein